MLVNRENFRLHLPWLVVFTAGSLLAALCVVNFSDLREVRFEFPGGSSNIGYPLGLLAGLIILFEILLWPRKKLLRRWRIGRVRTWMAAHIWLGLLTIPLAVAHAGFPWGGNLAIATMILLLIVVASGVVGLAVQQVIPRKMTAAALGESIHSQVGVIANQMVVEADALLSAVTGNPMGDTNWSELCPQDKGGTELIADYVGAGRSIANTFGRAFVVELPTQPLANTAILGSAYEDQIREFLHSGQKSKSLLNDVSRQISFFEDLRRKVAPEAHYVVDQLQDWSNERRQLDIQVSLHNWLHWWLAIHLPLSITLLVCLIWHAITATKNSGVPILELIGV